ncbi:conjugative transposon protein TraM [Algoriphagus sp. YJ13C]|uniref:Conjugative transposon protein TraM n=2 Tax=Algoriphagus pacificus TaxID=2811234 RepID=A0ABS3CKZ3_9BACT|nr:conjugative transposon protein TraM [Algoriphagus pacificus]
MNNTLPAPIIPLEQETKAAAYAFQEKKGKEKAEPLAVPKPLIGEESDRLLWDGDIELGIPAKFQRDRSIDPFESDDQEKQIHKKLADLDQLISDAESRVSLKQDKELTEEPSSRPELGSTVEADLIQMEELMRELESGTSKPDMQLEQLSEIMDKLLLLQDPERIIRKEESPILVDERSFPALKEPSVLVGESMIASLEEETLNESQNGFYGLSDNGNLTAERNAKSTIAAIIPRTQALFPGETLEIKLEESIWIQDKEIPAGTPLFGKTALSGDRLSVKISGIIWEEELFPLAMVVYGADAVPGIPVNSKSVGSELSGNGFNELQGLGMMGVGMDWQGQLANTGLQATKGLLKSKSNAKQISVKAGHPIFLINTAEKTIK